MKKYMNKKIITVLLAVMAAFFASINCYAFDMDTIADLADSFAGNEEKEETDHTEGASKKETVFSEGDFQYEGLTDGTLQITKYSGTEESVVIPEKVQGFAVKELGQEAFADCVSLTTVEIPESVNYIGTCCFKGCDNLEDVTIKNNSTSILENAFEGCSFQPDSSKYTIISESYAGVDPDFKATMDHYEDFFEEYVGFLESYDENDMSAMLEYASMLTEYLETLEALEKIDEEELGAEEMAYYIDTMARIEKLLILAADYE